MDDDQVQVMRDREAAERAGQTKRGRGRPPKANYIEPQIGPQSIVDPAEAAVRPFECECGRDHCDLLDGAGPPEGKVCRDALISEGRKRGIFGGMTAHERRMLDDGLDTFKAWWCALPGSKGDHRARGSMVDMVESIAKEIFGGRR